MKRPPVAFALSFTAMLVLTLVTIAVAQSPDQPRSKSGDMWNPPWMQRDMWGPDHMGPGMRQRMARHWMFMHQGSPMEYWGATNPYSLGPRVVLEGGELYQQHCARCHGETGMGDGENANALNPSPALLAYLIQRPMAVDEYLLWSISDGGTPFASNMPAFKDSLEKDAIWKIVTFMRAGFPVASQM